MQFFRAVVFRSLCFSVSLKHENSVASYVRLYLCVSASWKKNYIHNNIEDSSYVAVSMKFIKIKSCHGHFTICVCHFSCYYFFLLFNVDRFVYSINIANEFVVVAVVGVLFSPLAQLWFVLFFALSLPPPLSLSLYYSLISCLILRI